MLEYDIFSRYELCIHRGHITDLPPSIARVCPVMKEASSEARKAIVFAEKRNNVKFNQLDIMKSLFSIE